MLQPVVLRSDQTDLAQRAGEAVRRSGLLPAPERNDAIILAEAAVLHCLLLVSQDSHLYGLDRANLKKLLSRFDLAPPLIASPREIVKKFYMK